LGGYGLALAALALVVFGAIECPPPCFRERYTCCVCKTNTAVSTFFLVIFEDKPLSSSINNRKLSQVTFELLAENWSIVKKNRNTDYFRLVSQLKQFQPLKTSDFMDITLWFISGFFFKKYCLRQIALFFPFSSAKIYK